MNLRDERCVAASTTSGPSTDRQNRLGFPALDDRESEGSNAAMNTPFDLPAPASWRVEGDSWLGLRMTLTLSSVDGQSLVEKDLRLPSSFIPASAVVTLRDLEGNILRAEYSEFGPKRPELS
jgi:hypothetical protein